MKSSLKAGIVAAGYLGAALLAALAVAVRKANTSDAEALASSGMNAFGDFYLFVASFAVLALVPSAVALYCLKPYRRFWDVVSGLAIGLAFTGAAAAVLYALAREAASASALAPWAAFSVLRILLAPVLAPAFLAGAFFAPYRLPRGALLAASAVELAVVAYAALAWFVPAR